MAAILEIAFRPKSNQVIFGVRSSTPPDMRTKYKYLFELSRPQEDCGGGGRGRGPRDAAENIISPFRGYNYGLDVKKHP